jgi:predicted nucleic acid-binding protein
MSFTLIPDDLPRPSAYLRAGLLRPDNTPIFTLRNAIVDRSTADAPLADLGALVRDDVASTTFVDRDGAPTATLFEQPRKYIVGPPTVSLWAEAVTSLGRDANGYLRVELEAPTGARKEYEPSDRIDVSTARLVTFDTSVLMAGVDKTKFAPDDGLFVSAAIDQDLAVMFGSSPMPHGQQGFTSWRSWDQSVPVPVDAVVRRIFKRLSDTGDLWSEPHSRLDRTDLLCAATAIAYGARLYTTHPDDYAGLRNGLRVIAYGPTRNKAALAARVALADAPPASLVETLLRSAAPRPAPRPRRFDDVVARFDRGDEFSDEDGVILDRPHEDTAQAASFIARVLAGADDDVSAGWKAAVIARAEVFAAAIRSDEQHHLDVISTLSLAIHEKETHRRAGEPSHFGPEFVALARWGNWPDDTAIELEDELREDPDNVLLHNYYRASLLMAGVGEADAATAVADAVERGVVLTRDEITELSRRGSSAE